MSDVVVAETIDAHVATSNGLPEPGELVINTVPMDTIVNRKLVFNSTESARALDDFIGKRIDLVDVIVQVGEFANEQTGAIERQPRVILIDKDGNAYVGVSMPLYRTTRSLLRSFADETGRLPEPMGITVTREQGSVKGRTFFRLKLV